MNHIPRHYKSRMDENYRWWFPKTIDRTARELGGKKYTGRTAFSKTLNIKQKLYLCKKPVYYFCLFACVTESHLWDLAPNEHDR